MRLVRIGQALLLAGMASALGAAAPEVTVKLRGADITRSQPAPAPQDLRTRLPQLTLVVYDVHALLESDFAELVEETGAIFEEMGVDIG